MPNNIPTWKEMTSYEGWASFDNNKKNRIREQWLTDIRKSDPKMTDSDALQLRDSIYEEDVAREPPPVSGLVPPQGRIETKRYTPPQRFTPPTGLANGQPDALSGKQWDYNTETKHAVVRDDEVSDWRDASDEERSLIQDAIGIPAEEIIPQDKTQKELGLSDALKKALIATSRRQLEGVLDPFAHPLEHLAKFSAPLSFVAGAITEAAKIEDRGSMQVVGDALKEGFKSFYVAAEKGEIKDASSIRKEIQGKSYEEQYGLLWGTLANMATSSVLDPLIVGGFGAKMLGKLVKVAKGLTTADDAAIVLNKVSTKMSPEMQEIVKMAGKTLKDPGFRIVRKQLPPAASMEKMVKEVSGVPVKGQLALPEGQVAKGALEARKAIPLAERTLTKPPIVVPGKEPGFKVAQKALKAPKELPPAKGIVGAGKTTPKPRITPKMTEGDIAKEVSNVEVIDTVEKFVQSGGKITKVAPKQHRYRAIVGKETVRQLKKKAAYELGIDVEILRGTPRIGETISEYTTKAAKYGDDEGVYLGSILGSGAKYFERLLNVIKGKSLSPRQGDDFIKKSFLSVEKPWAKISTDVGFAIKNMHSRADSVRSQALDAMKDIAKIGRTGWRGLVKPGEQAKKFVKEDLSEIPLALESKEYFNKLSLETKKRIKPAMDRLDKFFKDAQSKYKEYGVSVDFKGRLISNIIDDNANMLQKIRDIKAGKISRMGSRDLNKFGIDVSDIKDFNPNNMKQVKRILGQQIRDNTSIGKRVNNLEYVHIPYAQWFDTVNRGSMLKALKLANAAKRKTIAISDLVEAGAVKKGDVNVFDIMASYGDRMAKDFAVLDIKKAALQSGLISKKKLPGMVKMDGRKAPLFHDVHMHPAFKNWLYDFQAQTYNQNKIDKGFSLSKMAQFTKPAFLGFYNMFQSAAARGPLGLLDVKGVYNDTAKALRMMTKHTDDYYEAIDAGIKSTPYSIPWNQYTDTIKRLATTTVGENANLFIKQNKTVLKPIYETLWNTAWVLGDELPRLSTYNYLKRTTKMSSHEAAQMAALFHSDYASIPINTRRFLNRPFFTPTFKMTMFKLYKNMLQASYQVPKKALTGKMRDITPQEKILAKGALSTVFGVMGGMDVTMTKFLGYERDQFARRYYKLVEDEDGKVKESVVVFANPLTLIPKYAQKAYKVLANEDYEDNTLKVAYDQMKFELHPIPKTLGNIVENKKDNRDPIYQPYSDSDAIKWAKRGVYFTTEMIKILKEYTMPQDVSQEKAKEIFKNDVGKIFDTLTSPMRFNYLRGPRHVALRRRLRSLQADVQAEKNKLLRTGTLDKATARSMNEVLLKKQIKLQKAIAEAEEKYDRQIMKLGLQGRDKKKSHIIRRGARLSPP